jgi:hypothetical protein
LKGKVMVEIIPGTVEEQNPTDTLRTDVEYARYLVGLKNAGRLGDGQIFPTVHGAVGGDPRDQYFVVTTDAQNVAPAIDSRNPTVDQANQRVADLAKQHASVVTSDWVGLTTVLPQVLTRG